MYLVILKNYHSTIEDIINTHEDVKPNEVWTVWRHPWQRFISGVWHDIVQHQTTKTPRTTDHYFTEIKQKLRDKITRADRDERLRSNSTEINRTDSLSLLQSIGVQDGGISGIGINMNVNRDRIK